MNSFSEELRQKLPLTRQDFTFRNVMWVLRNIQLTVKQRETLKAFVVSEYKRLLK